jgi:hypothetical protein
VEVVLSILLGIGLSAACGFRLFVPLLVVSIASYSGHLTLAESFEWVGTTPALVLFGVATVVEIAGYYIPWVDNLLDSIALPAAVVAGTVVTASVVTDMSPLLRYTLALIAGGGAAVTVKGLTAIVRAGSSLTTGGLANPVVSTGEAIGSLLLSVLAILLPLVAGILAIGLVLLSARKIRSWLGRRRARSS